MIKFFRRLRQKYLAENKITNYIFYAIGEIVLVVIGILLALQINNWNQEKQNRKQEQQILSQLLEEYNSNLDQIESKIAIRNDILSSALNLLRYTKMDPENVNVDSLDIDLFVLSIRPTFDPELSVTNELINSGKLYFLQNLELRKRVSAFSSSLSELIEEEVAITNLTEERLIPFLIENYQIGGMQMVLVNDNSLRAKFTMGNLKEYDSLEDLAPPADFRPLLEHPDFQDYLFQMISYNVYTNEQSDGVKNKILEIITMVEKEIEE